MPTSKLELQKRISVLEKNIPKVTNPEAVALMKKQLQDAKTELNALEQAENTPTSSPRTSVVKRPEKVTAELVQLLIQKEKLQKALNSDNETIRKGARVALKKIEQRVREIESQYPEETEVPEVPVSKPVRTERKPKKEPSEKPAKETERRGRPRKTETGEEKPTRVAGMRGRPRKTETGEEKPTRVAGTRGRPRKERTPKPEKVKRGRETKMETPTETPAKGVIKRGRPSKAETTAETPKEKPTKGVIKRGRPSLPEGARSVEVSIESLTKLANAVVVFCNENGIENPSLSDLHDVIKILDKRKALKFAKGGKISKSGKYLSKWQIEQIITKGGMKVGQDEVISGIWLKKKGSDVAQMRMGGEVGYFVIDDNILESGKSVMLGNRRISAKNKKFQGVFQGKMVGGVMKVYDYDDEMWKAVNPDEWQQAYAEGGEVDVKYDSEENLFEDAFLYLKNNLGIEFSKEDFEKTDSYENADYYVLRQTPSNKYKVERLLSLIGRSKDMFNSLSIRVNKNYLWGNSKFSLSIGTAYVEHPNLLKSEQNFFIFPKYVSKYGDIKGGIKYAKGGGVESVWGGVRGRLRQPMLSFSKIDYDVNIDPKNMEVDVNIKKADTVNHYSLSETGAEWKQHSWGYMVYPKTIEQLYDVLKALRTNVSKERLKRYFEGKKYAKGGGVDSSTITDLEDFDPETTLVFDGDANFEDFPEITYLGNLQIIKGDGNFRNSQVQHLGNLQTIGGSADFMNSRVEHLGNLQTIGGSADFEDSEVQNLGNLQTIGGNANFENSEIRNLGKLQTIGHTAFFQDSQVQNLGNLQTIGGSAFFENSIVKRLGNLQTIGGRTFFGNRTDLEAEWEQKQKGNNYAEGGGVEIPKNKSLRHFILNEMSDGMIANKVPYSDYDTIGKIRIQAVQILNRDGDREYSMQSVSDLIQEALLEYEENKSEMNFAEGGGVRGNTITDLKDFDPNTTRIIDGDANFGMFPNITDLGVLSEIKGDADFSDSQVEDLGNLQIIRGDANFTDSILEGLGELHTIGGRAEFVNSQIRYFRRLRTIGGNANFQDSQVEDLGTLQEIGGNADFDSTQIQSLGNLHKIGGNAWFTNSQIRNLGNLEEIGGFADFENSEIQSLGNLTTIGGYANFENSQVQDLGILQMIGGSIDWGNRTDLQAEWEGEEYDENYAEGGGVANQIFIYDGDNVVYYAKNLLLAKLWVIKNWKKYDELVVMDSDGDSIVITKEDKLKDIEWLFSGSHYAKGGGVRSFLSKAKSYGKTALDKSVKLGKSAKEKTQEAIRQSKKKIALDVLYDVKENLAEGRDEQIAVEKAFYVVDDRYAEGGGVRGNTITDLKDFDPNTTEIIDGDANFGEFPNIIDLGVLSEIKGDADFFSSEIESLGNLKTIGGYADFENSRIRSLGRLKTIGGDVSFAYSQVQDLGNLQTISGDAHFENSQIQDLGNLKVIGGLAFWGDKYELQAKWETRDNESFYALIEKHLNIVPVGSVASGGGYGPFKKTLKKTWVGANSIYHSRGLAEFIGGFNDFKIIPKE